MTVFVYNSLQVYLLYSNESIPFRVYQENGDYQVKQEQGVTHTFVEMDRAINIAKIFTVLALSFHALLEGMAVGLETDSTDIWIMFIGNQQYSNSKTFIIYI